MALAFEAWPVAEEVVVVPCVTRVTPLVDTLRFCPGALELDDEEEPVLDGLADASHGVAASPTPMPSATANAPTRPIYLAQLISGSSRRLDSEIYASAKESHSNAAKLE
jgi:hypothetical protein